jgi:hypothetical protein
MSTSGWRIALAATISALLTAQAEARGVRIDFLDTNFESFGVAWDPVVGVDVTSSPAQVAAVDIGFDIQFGSVTVNTLYIHEDGYVSFNAADGADFIAPFRADLTQTVTVVDPTDAILPPGSVSYSGGYIDLEGDPFGDPPDPYDASEANDAFRVTWYGMIGTTEGSAQLVLINRGRPGDFDIEFNYQDFADLVPTSAGFALGGSSLDFGGPFANSPDHTFAFRNGVYGTAPAHASVPEPGSLTLLAAGLLLLGIALQHRRVSGRLAATVRPG